MSLVNSSTAPIRFGLVFCGGVVGTAIRAGLTAGLPHPWAVVWGINLVGSVMLGFLGARLSRKGWTGLKLLLGTGFCGGLTTYSTFALDVVISAENSLFASFGYAVLTVVSCTLFALLGIVLEKRLV